MDYLVKIVGLYSLFVDNYVLVTNRLAFGSRYGQLFLRQEQRAALANVWLS